MNSLMLFSYAAFRRDMLIPSKRVKIYHGDKRRVNKSVLSAVGEWKLAFECGDATDLHPAAQQLRIDILKEKGSHKITMENKTRPKHKLNSIPLSLVCVCYEVLCPQSP